MITFLVDSLSAERIELKEEQNNMVSFPQIPQIDDGPPNDMIYFPQTPQTSQIESESGSNLDSNEEEEISVKRKMGTLMTYGIDDIVGDDANMMAIYLVELLL